MTSSDVIAAHVPLPGKLELKQEALKLPDAAEDVPKSSEEATP